MAGGIGEMLVGGVLWVIPDPTLTTKVGGGALIGHGADMASAGLKQLLTGKTTQTLTVQAVAGGLQSVGVPSPYASMVGGLTEIGVAAMPIGIVGKVGPLIGDVAKSGVKPLLGKPASTGADVAIGRIPRITGSGLTRVESHLDAVLKNQFSDLPRSVALQFQVGERSMLKRLQSGMTSPRDIEFYMHELKESARFRATGSLMDAHNAALQWRGVTSKDLFHPDVISKYPEIFGKGW